MLARGLSFMPAGGRRQRQQGTSVPVCEMPLPSSRRDHPIAQRIAYQATHPIPRDATSASARTRRSDNHRSAKIGANAVRTTVGVAY